MYGQPFNGYGNLHAAQSTQDYGWMSWFTGSSDQPADQQSTSLWDQGISYITGSGQPATATGGSWVPAAMPLRRGMQGPPVSEIQRLLVAKGYSVGTAGPDGLFGAGTENAVGAFQRNVGLPVTRIVNDATLAALRAPVGTQDSVAQAAQEQERRRTGEGAAAVASVLGQAAAGFLSVFGAQRQAQAMEALAQAQMGAQPQAPQVIVQAPEQRSFPILPVVVGGVLALGIGGAAIFFATREAGKKRQAR